jgi:succinoglycan biosynthesis protein ExoV
MKLIFCEAVNFGDAINPWLWDKVFPNLFDEDRDNLFLGIGTILWTGHPKKARKYVFGSGYGSETPPDSNFGENWVFYCVRGPKTAKMLGLDPSLAIADPAILVKEFYQPITEKKYKISFIPHFTHEARCDLGKLCHDLNINLISPSTNDVEQVMNAISASEIVIVEAMHGAIVADALRVPWIPVDFHGITLNNFKWNDWCESMDLEYNPFVFIHGYPGDMVFKKTIRKIPVLYNIYLSMALQKIMTNPQPILSKDAVLNQKINQLQEKLAHFPKFLQECGYVNDRYHV